MRLDWAGKFLKGVYQPIFSHTFMFQDLLVSEVFLKDLVKYKKVSIAFDYINFTARII